jgi:hypothetical protein
MMVYKVETSNVFIFEIKKTSVASVSGLSIVDIAHSVFSNLYIL